MLFSFAAFIAFRGQFFFQMRYSIAPTHKMTGAKILRVVNHEDESKANNAAYAPINITTNVKLHFNNVFIGLLLFFLIEISFLSCDDNGARQLSVIWINRHGNITRQGSKLFYFATIDPISFKDLFHDFFSTCT